MALHVTSEVGKPGRNERERRHYCERRGCEADLMRGRRYINPGRGDQPEWHPHVQKKDVKYTEHGLDWTSRAKFIPPPAVYAGEYPEEITLPKLRCYPDKHASSTTTAEWTAYPEGYYVGKRCKFGKQDELQHLATITSSNEINHSKNRKLNNIWEKRGAIPAASKGDKSYQAPEYSQGFHHLGSTRPVVNFGGTIKLKADTFVPLQDLPLETREPFRSKERRRKHVAEMDSVLALNEWTPAPPLVAMSF